MSLLCADGSRAAPMYCCMSEHRACCARRHACEGKANECAPRLDGDMHAHTDTNPTNGGYSHSRACVGGYAIYALCVPPAASGNTLELRNDRPCPVRKAASYLARCTPRTPARAPASAPGPGSQPPSRPRALAEASASRHENAQGGLRQVRMKGAAAVGGARGLRHRPPSLGLPLASPAWRGMPQCRAMPQPNNNDSTSKLNGHKLYAKPATKPL